jgi:membrane-associated protein
MIEAFLEALRTLTTPEKLLHLLSAVITGWLGYLLLFGIVFSETGLLVGFFLPGDSLLFTVGVVCGAGGLDIVTINLVLWAATVIGDTTGYWLGRHTGPRIFNRPDSLLFHRDHLARTQAFYDKHGGKTIIYARFVPIIRTFAPFVAGVGKMSYTRFLAFSVLGGLAWVASMTLAGFYLGNIPVIRRHFEKVVVGIVVVSVAPVLLEGLKAYRRRRAA